jgi:hypothetical protein
VRHFITEKGSHYYQELSEPRRSRSYRELILKVNDLIPLLLVIGFAHLNLWVQRGNVMCLRLESMGGACSGASLVTSIPQKSIICLQAQKELMDRCIANILSTPKGQTMLKEKTERRNV